MFCPNCGHEIRPTDNFCPNCGSKIAEREPAVLPAEPIAEAAPAAAALPVEAPEAPQEKKGFQDTVKGWWAAFLVKAKPVLDNLEPYYTNKKLVAFLGGGIVTIIILLIILGLVYSGNGFTPMDHSVTFAGNVDGMVFLYDNKVIKTDLEGSYTSSVGNSIDGSVYAFLTNKGTLGVIRKGKMTVVCENASSFELSVSGAGLIYYDEDDNTYRLYTVKSGKSKVIAAREDRVISSISISPDGKTAAYLAVNTDDLFGGTDLYYFDGEDSKKLGSAATLLGISNKGKYIYCIAQNDSGDYNLYSFNKKGNKEKLSSSVSILTNSAYFNEDHTQILFYNDGKTYIAEKDHEAQKISSNRISPLLPRGYAATGRTLPMEDLYGHVYYGSDSNYRDCVWYIDEDDSDSCKLLTNYDSIQLSDDAEYLYYIDTDGELGYIEIDDGEDASENKTVIVKEATGFLVTPDRDRVYYLADGNLYSCNANSGSKRRKVEDDISSFQMNMDGVVYYEYEGDLYATANGKSGKKIGTDIEGISMVTPLYIYAHNSDTLYVTNGTKKLKKLLTID